MVTKKISMYGRLSKMVITALSFSLFFPVFVNAQTATTKKANIWYFGDKAGLDFSGGNPVPLTNGVLQSFEGSAVASSDDGQLLFYSNGGSTPYQGAVWNRNHQMMPNGNLTGAGGCNSSIQSSLILPLPNSSSKHYLFTTDCMENGATGGLRYNIIDMNLDGGLGDVAVKARKLADSVDESLTAVQHANGKDWWIISHKMHSDTFFVHHLTENGITGLIKTKIGNTTPDYAGVLVASSDGKKIVHAGQSFTSLFKFDNATGKITDHIDLGTAGYTAAFSPNCNMLYVGDGIGKNIYQFTLAAEDIPSTKFHVGTIDATGVGGMQLGPDGKIYIARFVSSNTLSVIAYPDRRGSRCAFVDRGINLGGKIAKGGLPNFPNNYVGKCAASLPTSGKVITSSAPLNIRVQSIVGNGATIVWNPTPVTSLGYTVLYREKGAKEWTAENTYDNSIFISDLKTNSDYEVAVIEKEEADVDYITVTDHLVNDLIPVSNTAAEKKNFATVSLRSKADFTVAPNPASTLVTLDLKNINSEVKTYVRITDVSGAEVYSEVLNAENVNHSINTGNLKDGIYFISILSDTNDGKKVLETKKLLVAH